MLNADRSICHQNSSEYAKQDKTPTLPEASRQGIFPSTDKTTYYDIHRDPREGSQGVDPDRG